MRQVSEVKGLHLTHADGRQRQTRHASAEAGFGVCFCACCKCCLCDCVGHVQYIYMHVCMYVNMDIPFKNPYILHQETKTRKKIKIRNSIRDTLSVSWLLCLLTPVRVLPFICYPPE